MQPSRKALLLTGLLIGLTLFVRFGVWYVHVDRPSSYVEPDTQSYLQPGQQLLTDGTFPSFMRTPVYPLFLAFLERTVSSDPRVWALAQILLSLGTVGITAYLAQQVFGRPAALLTVFFMAGDVTSAIAANQLMSETLFAFLLMACLLGVWHVRQKSESGWAVFLLVGAGLGALTLCRPIGFLLFVVLAGWLFAVWQHAGRSRSLCLALFCLASLAPPAAWIVRNRIQTGEYFLSTIVATNLYEYRAAWNVAQLSNRSFDEVHREFEQEVQQTRDATGMNAGQLAKWEMAKGIDLLTAHPLLTLRQGLDGLLKMYFGISTASINDLSNTQQQHGLADSRSLVSHGGQQLISQSFPWWVTAIKVWALGYLFVLYAAALLAVVFFAGHNRPAERRQFVYLLLLVIAYFTFFSVGAEAYSRFRVPVAPLLAMLAGAGSVEVIRWLRPQRNRTTI